MTATDDKRGMGIEHTDATSWAHRFDDFVKIGGVVFRRSRRICREVASDQSQAAPNKAPPKRSPRAGGQTTESPDWMLSQAPRTNSQNQAMMAMKPLRESPICKAPTTR